MSGVDPLKVFINYRHDGSAGHVGRLYDSLSRRFGSENVFMDVSTIDPGRDFVQAIHEYIDECHAFLAVISKGWLSAVDAEGRRRLDDPEDWVRLEIQVALEKGLMVIPVLLEGASIPGAEDLPTGLSRLVRHQAVEMTNAGWQDDVRRLSAAIQKARPPSEPVSGPTEFQYDAYVSYVDEEQDEAWVWDELVPRLEQANLRVAVSGDAHQPGVERLVAVERGITEAKRTVVVVSPAYLRDNMANFENVLAQTLGVEEGSYRVLPVTPPGAGDVRLPMRLQMLTVLDLGHPRRGERNLERLVAALQAPLPRAERP